MANPQIIALPKNTWVKVAVNVTTGNLWLMNQNPDEYLQTYRETGAPAPTDVSDGVPVIWDGDAISSSLPIDVYIYAVGQDGKIRIDV